MATVRPFKAVRPKKGMEKVIAALPYDVYNRKEAALVVRENPDSFLAIDKKLLIEFSVYLLNMSLNSIHLIVLIFCYTTDSHFTLLQ